MTVIHVEDPRIEVLRLRVERASLAFRWLGAAGVVLEDVAYLLRKFDRLVEERDTLRNALASMAPDLPPAGKEAGCLPALAPSQPDTEIVE